ncbi:hairy/enhancer-of-split related with YRPW motif protein-like [Centruroides sculpturatus]|uniref:hairy/enhancer-of-split related with YRPW motif protein-like n=1 Tax=Centruroides sculpturatus TaxID=218467 RepID=UPI000C6E34EB|nr:hairy/enhancer-of-split related with YRPW motif protein-like [Centruroides sculpturatus]
MMKRTVSDMESDCDDVFAEDSPKGTPTQSNESCQLLNRKRRRGIIEKRRRDRINNSLSELRRLVPAAFEKQGSAKLEKAEILQMTVDHLKMLHAKGFDALTFDPHKFAMDYHNIGFRECASEVARYLVAIEGMDLQDPLRLRLMSHLQCYAAQRELALKSASAHNPWNSPSTFGTIPPPAPSQYPAPSMTSQLHPSSAPAPMLTSEAPPPISVSSPYCSESRPVQLPMEENMHHGHHSMPRVSSSQLQTTMSTSSLAGGSSTMMTPLSQMPPNQYFSGHGFSSAGNYGPTTPSQNTPPAVKPYRPWGAELAY